MPIHDEPPVTLLAVPHNRLPDANFDLVVVAASLGGVEAVMQFVAALPADFDAPIAIVQHLAAPSHYPELMRLRTPLKVVWAAEGTRLRPRTLYVAPVDEHLLITQSFRCSTEQTGKVNYTRPAADVLFQSAARVCPGRTLAVVLTGLGRDGAEGARAIKRSGGMVIAQDAQTSRAPSMPGAAIATGCVDFVLPLECIARAVVSLVTVPGIEAIFPASRAA